MSSNNLLENIEYIKKIHREGKLTVALCEEFLNSLTLLTVKHDALENSEFLKHLKSPEKDMNIIHVAGTNGKGSVCSYVASILGHAGFRVGMFTSPHLVSITERFRIDGKDVENDIFVESFWNILNGIEDFQKEQAHKDYFPAYFEYLFFMAMIIYKEMQVDYLVLETGLGGRFDVTNIIEEPKVSVITEIGMDHMQYLGDSYEEIAYHKAGIIKKEVPVVFFDKRPESTKIIREVADINNAKMRCITEENIKNTMICTDEGGKSCVDFCFDSEYYNYVGLRLRGIAKYQTQNAALAISCIEELKNMGAQISCNDIKKGLSDVVWPCRMEEIKPGFIVDGAHNTDGIEAFLDSAREIDLGGRKILLFGAVSDKQYKKMASMICESKIFDEIAVSCLETGRSLDKKSLKDAFSIVGNVTFYDSVNEALDYIYSVRKDNDLIFAAGSLYLAGQLRGDL